MSNYPPTPAFGGGFTMSRPSFPGPKPGGATKVQTQLPASAPHYTTRFPRPHEKPAPVMNVGVKGGNGPNSSVMDSSEGDREEGEVSDVEMENAKSPSGATVPTNTQMNGNVNGKSVNNVALNIRDQPWDGNYGFSQHQASQTWGQNNSTNGGSGQASAFKMAQTSSTAAGESYNSQSAARPTQQQIEELRKKAQAAVLNLLPLKLTFKDFVDEGINPYILRQVFERIGLPIPPEDNTCSSTTAEAKQSLPPTAPRDDITAKEAQEKEAKEKEKEAKEKEKEAKEKEKEAKEKEKEAKRLMLQEKLRQQEMILREQEQRKKEQERLKKEEERQQREAAAEAAKKKEEEMRLQAEAAARKKQEDLRELEEKKRIVQQKFEEMRLPPKPPAPLISNPIVTSLPSTTRSVMIPGLLLDTMDMGPRAPQTPMTAPTVTHPEVSSTITLHQKQDDTMIKDTTDRGVDTRTTIRRKRPVAADFDTELNATPYHFKRRFGSLRVGDFVIELTDDEDGEDTEVDEAQSLASSAFYTAQTEANTIQRTSRSPSDTYTGAQQNDRNGKSPPARSTSTVNGADAAKQLQDTEEKIRKLREEILLRQEKKRKPSGTGASTATATPTRVSTPSSVPGLNNNTAPATSPVVSISSSIVPIPSLPPKPPTPLGSFDNPVAPIVRVSETSSIVSANVQNEESLKDVHPANTIVETTQEKGKNEVMIEQAQTQTLTHGHAELVPGRRAPDATLPRTEETETPKMREEAERLRMLLLSKRKAAEAKTIVAQQNAKPAETLPAAPAAAAVQSQVEPKEVTPTTKAMESTLVPEIPQDTRERSESPYEPTLDVVRKLSESPPYEPSLGPEDDLGAGVDTKMDIDEQDAEEGEILEESVAMDVDSEDEDYDNKVHVLDPVTAQKQVEDSTATVLQTPNENLSSTISAQAPNPVLLTSPDRVEHATNISVGNVTNVSKTATAPGLHSKDKDFPNVFTEYESPLRQFRSYRYHPKYLEMVKGGWRSLTFSHRIDPDKEFCVYEVAGGKCNDLTCKRQHFRQIGLSDDEILVELGSVMEGDTEAIKSSYRDGLRELITNMRARKVNDFETVAAEISRYRSRFFDDPTRVVRLTKG